MNTELQKVMARIAKMMKLSKNCAATEGEAAVAAAMAANLMRKYQIEHSDIILEELRQSDSVVKESLDEKIRFKNNAPLWYSSLSICVATIFDCQVKYEIKRGYIKTDYGNRDVPIMTVYGFKSDVEIVRNIFLYLEFQFNKLALSAWKKYLENDQYGQVSTNPSNIRSWKDKYKMGLFYGIRQKLEDLYKKEDDFSSEEQKAGYDLMVISKKKLIEGTFGKIDYISKDEKYLSEAMKHGLRDSVLVSISKVVNSTNSDTLLIR